MIDNTSNHDKQQIMNVLQGKLRFAERVSFNIYPPYQFTNSVW